MQAHAINTLEIAVVEAREVALEYCLRDLTARGETSPGCLAYALARGVRHPGLSPPGGHWQSPRSDGGALLYRRTGRTGLADRKQDSEHPLYPLPCTDRRGGMMAIDMRSFHKFDLNSLVTFLVVYQERGVTRAARRLNVTQPAVSNALGKLRMRFDDPLFIACGRHMRPTAKADLIAQALLPAILTLQVLLLEGVTQDRSEGSR